MIEPKILYSVSAKGRITQWSAWNEGADVIVEYGAVGGKMIRQRYTCVGKNIGRKNETTAEYQAEKEVKSLYEKKIKLKYNENLGNAGHTARVKPMLAQSYEKQCARISFPICVQPKLDGVRCVAYRVGGKVVLQSRNGDLYEVLHIAEALDSILDEKMILDGELYLHGASLQTITSLVRRQQPESLSLQYIVYDVPSSNGIWTDRQQFIQGLQLNAMDIPVHCIPCYIADSEQEVFDLQKKFVADGFEGAIVRQHNGIYRQGYRSPDLLKLKDWQDAEYKIIGWKTGRGEHENIPTFQCVTSEGKEFDVTPKGTRSERADMLKNADSYIGKLMKVKFFDLTDDGKPHFPVGLGIRDESDL